MTHLLTTAPDIYYDMLALVPIGGKEGGIWCITRELSNFLFASEVIPVQSSGTKTR